MSFTVASVDGAVVSTHLFGSRAGYRTLSRSVDVTDAEDAELAVFGFGQTADRAVLEALETEPTAYGRPLVGGRIAITRIFPGAPDESGRATLELRTILVPQDSIGPLLSIGFGWMLHQQDLWDRSAFERGSTIKLNPVTVASRRTPPAEEAFAAWADAVIDPESECGIGDEAPLRSSLERPIVILEPESEGSMALAAMAASMHPSDLAVLRWGVRLLSTGIPVDVATLSSSGRAASDRPVLRHRMGSDDRGIATTSLAEDRDSTRLPSLSLVARRGLAGSSRDRRRSRSMGSLWTVLLATTPIVIVVAIILAIADWGRRPETTETPRDSTSPTPVSALERQATPTGKPDPSPPEITPAPKPTSRTGSNVATGTSEAEVLDSEEGPSEGEPVDRTSESTTVAADGSGPPPSGGRQETLRASQSLESRDEDASESAMDEGDAEEVSEEAETENTDAGDPQNIDRTVADDVADTDDVAEVGATPVGLPDDPCLQCGIAFERTRSEIARALAADRAEDRESFDIATASAIATLRSIGLEEVSRSDRIEALTRIRGVGRPDPERFSEDWTRLRVLLCRLEAWYALLDDLESLSQRMPSGSSFRREIATIRRDALWALGSAPPRAAEIRVRIGRLKQSLRVQAQASSSDERAEIVSWIDLEQAFGSEAWLEGRFEPPAALVDAARDAESGP